MKLCSIPGCAKPLHGRGFCGRHFQRWKKHGDALHGKDFRPAGSGSIRPDGYVVHGTGEGNVLGHILVAERALGKPLPPGAQVHHWDRNRANNDPSNLLICPDQAYHRLIHRRMDALEACGNPNWISCRLCKRYDDPGRMYVAPGGVHAYHRECSAAYARQRRLQRESLAAGEAAA